jgi:capsular exopolysaccharide synthesis family protein
MSANASERLDAERVLLVLRRRWWVISLFTTLVAAASFAFSTHQTKQYTATASVLFQNPQLSQEESGLQATPSSPAEDPTIMATNIQLLTQKAGVAEATARIIGHGLTTADVSQAISVSQQGQTSVANVSATSTEPSVAAAIANTYAGQFIAAQQAQQRASVEQALNLVERQIAALSKQQIAGTSGQALQDRAESLRILANLQDGGAQVVDSAKVPTSPSSPKPLRNTALGVLLGLLLGLTAAFLLERLDRRMKTVEDLEQTYRLPLLAEVPHDKSYARPPTAAGPDYRGQREVFRLLRAYLRYFNVDREIRSLLIVSAAPGDGKTTVARNLAQAAQETGTQTLLIDADFRRPNVARFFALRSEPGLSEVLIGSVEPEQAVQSIPIATRVNGTRTEVALDVLVAGHPPPNPAELIESHAMADTLAWAADRYELVVIDTAPLSVVSDAIPLLRRVDGVVLVSHLGKNTRDAAAFLRDRLASVNAPLLGVVANGANPKSTGGYGYGYGDYAAEPRDVGALFNGAEPGRGPSEED